MSHKYSLLKELNQKSLEACQQLDKRSQDEFMDARIASSRRPGKMVEIVEEFQIVAF